MLNEDKPVFISIGNYQDSRGSLSILEDKQIPFEVHRTYWINQVPESTKRGGHAHKTSRQLLICTRGTIEVELEGLAGAKFLFGLDPSQNQGLYLPPLYWGYFTFKDNAMALCMASDYYDESDYIRDYEEFEKLRHDHLH